MAYCSFRTKNLAGKSELAEVYGFGSGILWIKSGLRQIDKYFFRHISNKPVVHVRSE